MHTVNFLKHLIENYELLVYLFIFFGLIIEGEVILISAGIFLHLDALDPEMTVLIITLGVFAKTFLGYYIGTFIHDRCHKMKLLRYIEKRVFSIMPHFKKNPFWSIFISKFIIGFNNVVIIFSGYQKINFQKYLKAEVFSTLIWAPLLVSLGYIFSTTALSFSREVWRFSFIVLLFVLGFIVLDKLIGWALEIFEEFYHEHVE